MYKLLNRPSFNIFEWGPDIFGCKYERVEVEESTGSVIISLISNIASVSVRPASALATVQLKKTAKKIFIIVEHRSYVSVLEL